MFYIAHNHGWFVLLACVALANGTKWLLDNPGFDDPQCWESSYPPCSLDEVIFPESYLSVLPLPEKEVYLSGFTLAKDGAILLSQESTISFGSKQQKNRECRNKNNKAYLAQATTRKWFDPKSWRTTAEMTRNMAIPHMERVPCNNESIIVQRKGPLSIDLENVHYMRMGQLNLAGSLVSKDYLKQLINTDVGQILFKHSEGLAVEYYRNDVCGCYKDFSEFEEPVCKNILSTCSEPHCRAPVKPFESCCAICGSVLMFSIESCDDDNLNKLRKVISLAISEQNLVEDLDYYVHYINSAEKGKYLQAIIIDRNSYSEKSVSFVQRLNTSTDWNKLFKRPLTFKILFSGAPYNPSVTFGSVVLITLCLLLVIFVALVIFSHYAPDNRYVGGFSQQLFDVNRWRTLINRSRAFVFQRFDNTAAAGEAERQSEIIVGYNISREVIQERAFDNPMFQETEVRSPKHKENKKTSVTIETLEDIDPQELKEIKLDSSSEESDYDTETIE